MNNFYLTDNNTILNIVNDEFPTSPREWDNLGTFYTFLNSYVSPDEHNYKSFNDFLTQKTGIFDCDNTDKVLIEFSEHYFYLLVRFYAHSGISYSTSPLYPYNDRWDSGLAGIIFVSKENVVTEFNLNSVDDINSEVEDKVYTNLENEVNLYNQYANGEVYGFVEYDNLGNEIDSCWGYFDEDDILNEKGCTEKSYIRIFEERCHGDSSLKKVLNELEESNPFFKKNKKVEINGKHSLDNEHTKFIVTYRGKQYSVIEDKDEHLHIYPYSLMDCSYFEEFQKEFIKSKIKEI